MKKAQTVWQHMRKNGAKLGWSLGGKVLERANELAKGGEFVHRLKSTMIDHIAAPCNCYCDSVISCSRCRCYTSPRMDGFC